MVFDKATWKTVGVGYSTYDCAILDKELLVTLAYEKTESPQRDLLPRTRFTLFRLARPIDQKRFVVNEVGNFGFAHIAWATAPLEFIAVDTGSNVFSYDKDRAGEEPRHPDRALGSELATVVTQVVRIGTAVYTVGGPRRLHKRQGVGRWTDITASLKLPKDVDKPGKGLDYIWHSAAGFSEEDIYAVGGLGDVWHFDGKKWKQLAFPSNELLFNVCCAGDGNVYIGGNMGSLYVGRENAWTKLHGSSQSVPWKDIAWFGGKLWCGSDYGLWELKDKKVIRAEIPAHVQLSSGALDVSPDGQHLLTAGPDGASLFDGKSWQVLFNRHDFE